MKRYLHIKMQTKSIYDYDIIGMIEYIFILRFHVEFHILY